MVSVLYDRKVDKAGDFYFNRNEALNEAKVALHLHNSIELKFIIDGDYYVMIDGEEIMCKRGDVIFVDSRQPHAYMSVGESINYVLVIDNDIFKAVLPKGKALLTHFTLDQKFKIVEDVLDEAFDEWAQMSYEKRKGFVFRVLGMLLQYNGAVTQVADEENLVPKIMEYIREHCHEEIKLENLAKTFGYSKNYFSNFFNKHFYMNLRECVNRFRIERALKLMEENGKSVSLGSIAERCGYNSMNTFYRALKRYAGEINVKDS